MLHLKLPTDPRWAEMADKSLEDILTDHAFCEQKAATTCISLIAVYPNKVELVNTLAPVVTEEWGHFRMVLNEINKRGFSLGKQRKDEYVNLLLRLQRKQGRSLDILIDRLLICALIEARSCERFKIFSEYLDDIYLKNFYKQFMESEAGHYTLFMELAHFYSNRKEVDNRWQYFLLAEADIMSKIALRGDRVH